MKIITLKNMSINFESFKNIIDSIPMIRRLLMDSDNFLTIYMKLLNYSLLFMTKLLADLF